MCLSPKVLCLGLVLVLSVCCGASKDRPSYGRSFIISKIRNGILEKNSGLRSQRDLSSKWPFFGSQPDPVPNRKPLPQYGKPGKPKPTAGPQQVWSWNNDDKGWSSIGWINMQTDCANVSPASAEIARTTVTQFVTEYETETVTEGFGDGLVTLPTTILSSLLSTSIAPPPIPSADKSYYTPTSTVFQTVFDHVTSTTWETSTTTLSSTSTMFETETSVISATVTSTSVQSTSTTSTIYSIVTATSYETSSITTTTTSTVMDTISMINDPVLVQLDATVVLEPSVIFYETTKTITSTVSETPTLTVHSTYLTSITTGIDVVTEVISLPFSTTPPITVTEYVATDLSATVDTSTKTILTSSPTCTVTSYSYLTTKTTPLITVTPSQCGNPCARDACPISCFPKVATTSVDITSTSIVTAIQPITVTYAGTETVTKFTYDESILTTTTSTAITKAPSRTTVTSTDFASLEVTTVYTRMSTSPPVTITTEHNLCTTTRFQTCTVTTTLAPVYLTLIDTQVVGVNGTVTQTSTSFTAPPVPTTTSFIQGGIRQITATATTTIVTDSRATTTTVTKDCTTVGAGETTITPTKTVYNIKTAVVTTTPVVNATLIKRRTLMAEEYTTQVTGKSESFYLQPSTQITDFVVVDVTPTPSIVTVTTLVVQMETSVFK